MTLVVCDHPFSEPLPKTFLEISIGEVLAPQRAVTDSGFREAAVEIQHADQPGPCAAPVGHGQDWAAMSAESCQHVMAVLPDCFRNHQRCVRIDFMEDFNAHLL